MVSTKVNDLEIVKLSDYFTYDKFRTVQGDAIMTQGGITEVPVVFNINIDFARRLTFSFSTMLIIYGFAIMNDKLKEINKNEYTATYMGDGCLKRITMNDCGEKFIMIFELSDAPDQLVTVYADEVEGLLNNCLHPNL